MVRHLNYGPFTSDPEAEHNGMSAATRCERVGCCTDSRAANAPVDRGAPATSCDSTVVALVAHRGLRTPGISPSRHSRAPSGGRTGSQYKRLCLEFPLVFDNIFCSRSRIIRNRRKDADGRRHTQLRSRRRCLRSHTPFRADQAMRCTLGSMTQYFVFVQG